MKILGISGSLRNARYGSGSSNLIKEIHNINTNKELYTFLQLQTKIRADEFLAAGREQGLPFDSIYRNLQKKKGLKGLSNSEAALAAGLWGAYQEGVEIGHVGLSRYFPMNGKCVFLSELKEIILSADALLISGPVYFGDRGSLIQDLVEFISSDDEIKHHLHSKVYAGIAVGAKRNGGQETQLIYQLIDMLNLNMLGVGNSAETTSQYGGTVVAGDVGTAWEDNYGIETSIGTGQRIAKVVSSINNASNYKLSDKTKIDIWLVQDSPDKKGLKHITQLIQSGQQQRNIQYNIIDLSEETIYRCIACDICPTHHAPRSEYSCIIKSKSDFLVKKHSSLMEADAILLAAYSPIGRQNISTTYQKFIERSRYMRRGSYMLSDRLVAPLIISEINANQNLHIRMLTSLVRHHTVLHHPIIAHEHEGEIINQPFFADQFSNFATAALTMTLARLTQDISNHKSDYNPIGYSISNEKNVEDIKQGVLTKTFNTKEKLFLKEQSERLNKN